MTRTNHGAIVPPPAPVNPWNEWLHVGGPCPYCKERTLWMYVVNSDYGDERYNCRNPACGAKWYAEGADS